MPTNVVTERNFNKVFPAEQRQRFWTRVERSLDEIFGVPRAAADKYRQEIEKAPVAEQLLVYHDEPLKVAADLAGIKKVTERQQKRYRELVESTEPSVAGLPDRP
jgi:hypothetical protein